MERIKNLGMKLIAISEVADEAAPDIVAAELMDIAREIELIRRDYTDKVFEDEKVSTIAYEMNFLVKMANERLIAENDEYLGDFQLSRAWELKSSGALESHNEFWTDFITLAGNVYGSVPVKLISKHAFDSLSRLGWRKIKVSIHEMHVDSSNGKEFGDLFKHYIAVRKKKSAAILVFEYHY